MQFSADNSGQSTSRKRTKNFPIRKLTARALAVTLAFFCAVNILALQPPRAPRAPSSPRKKSPTASPTRTSPPATGAIPRSSRRGSRASGRSVHRSSSRATGRSRCCRSSRPTPARPVDQVVKRGTRVLRSETADGSRWVSSFIRPLKTGWLSADFYDYPHHNGIDLAAPHGTPVYAAAQGRVVLAGWYGEYGKCVIIEHADGSRTLYGHNSSLDVSVGQEVKQGEKIANVGSTGNSTGNHLHFEIRIGSSFLDPLVYIDK